MFKLDFGDTAGQPGIHVGPSSSFLIEHDLLREGPEGAVIARHRDHHWEMEDGRKFFRLDVAGPVRLRFEKEGRPPQHFGPFEHYSMADGIAYVDRRFFASFSEKSGLWHCVELQEDWDRFSVVSEATA